MCIVDTLQQQASDMHEHSGTYAAAMCDVQLALAPHRVDWRRPPDPEELTDFARQAAPFGPQVNTSRCA